MLLTGAEGDSAGEVEAEAESHLEDRAEKVKLGTRLAKKECVVEAEAEVEVDTDDTGRGTLDAEAPDEATRRACRPSLARMPETNLRTLDEAVAEDVAVEEDREGVDFAEDIAAVSAVAAVSEVHAELSVEDVAASAVGDADAEANLVAQKEERAAPNSQHHQIC